MFLFSVSFRVTLDPACWTAWRRAASRNQSLASAFGQDSVRDAAAGFFLQDSLGNAAAGLFAAAAGRLSMASCFSFFVSGLAGLEPQAFLSASSAVRKSAWLSSAFCAGVEAGRLVGVVRSSRYCLAISSSGSREGCADGALSWRQRR